MSSFSVEYPNVVDAITSDIAVIGSDAEESQPYYRCKALWDTGAVFSVVSRRLVEKMGLVPIDRGFAYTVQGTYEPSVYLLDVLLPNKMLVKALRVSDGDFDDFDVLIGMDIIKLGDLMITNTPATKFVFRIPSEGAKLNP